MQTSLNYQLCFHHKSKHSPILATVKKINFIEIKTSTYFIYFFSDDQLNYLTEQKYCVVDLFPYGILVFVVFWNVFIRSPICSTATSCTSSV